MFMVDNRYVKNKFLKEELKKIEILQSKLAFIIESMF